MIAFPFAKVNLGLRILGRRPDGYHNIESVLYPVAWKDSLEFLPSAHQSFRSYGLPVERNGQIDLCERAYRMIKEKYALPALDIALLKSIPAGAGLGGGSSDAAAMLTALNKSFGLNISEAELNEMAARIGSDCPFFLQKRPAFVYERGERMEEFPLSLDRYQFLIAYPGIAVSTADAYRHCRPSGQPLERQRLLAEPPSAWDEFLVNDFEKSVFEVFPAIAQLKKKIKRMGALYAAMSGSGSAVYGIFREAPMAMDAARTLGLPLEYVYSGNQ